jgi:hypothetical protein
MDWEAVSEGDLRRAIRAIAGGDPEASVPVYRYLLGVAMKIAPGQASASTPITETLNVDVADEAIIDVVRGARTFRPELGDAKGWLFAVARNAYSRLKGEGRLGSLPGESSLSMPLGDHEDNWTLADIVEAKRAQSDENDAAWHSARIVREARDHGFLSQAECNALWLAQPSRPFGEAVAEWVFGDAARLRAGEKRCLTILLRLDVFLAISVMTNDDISRQADRAIEMEFVVAAERRGLLHYLRGDSGLRAAAVLDTAWGMGEAIRVALFGFIASVHLGQSGVRTAVACIEERPESAAWCVAHDWPEPCGRLLKKLPRQPPASGDADFWERIQFRTRIDGRSAAPTLHTLSVGDTRRLAHDLRTLSRGLRRARDTVANRSFSDEAVKWLRSCPDVSTLLEALGIRDHGLLDRDVLKEVLDAARQGEASQLALHVACRSAPELEESLRNLQSEVR